MSKNASAITSGAVGVSGHPPKILRSGVIRACFGAVLSSFLLRASLSGAADVNRPDEQEIIQVPAFVLPESDLLDKETRAELRGGRSLRATAAVLEKACQSLDNARPAEAPAIRKCLMKAFYQTALYKEIRDRYPIILTTQEIGGVGTEVFTPKDGIAARNRNRVLLNLHGGSFLDGSQTISQLESIPIASVGRIKVISVDYRMAPEYAFPAASEDVAAVYRDLLKTYPPQNIGIYGCSAGGLLTAEAVAWLQKEDLPRPGAVGMFCDGAAYWTEGDMGRFAIAREGIAPPFSTINGNPYFKNVDRNDPLAFPVRSREVLAKFPPSLLVSATRDLGLSSVVHTHALLVQQGVEAELHVWEGLGHAFFYDAALPASREVYDIAVKFFDRYLGQGSK